jgi:hypothetical protein
LKLISSKLAVATLLATGLVFSTSALAQNNDAKRALAVKLAQIQLKADSGAMADQLTGSAVQPLIAVWSQRLDETVPPARQKDVRDKLDAELKKFTDNTGKTIEAQVAKSAEPALVPIFMEKLTEDEMKTIIAYLESPVSAKFQSLGPDAANAWAKRVVDATRASVESGQKSFDSAAERIVNSSAPAAGGAKK